MIRAFLLALLLGLTPAAACEIQPQTTVPLELAVDHLTVTALVNGLPARLILDTGAERTMVTPRAVQRFGLTLDPWVGTTVMGIGGIERHRDAIPQSFELGGLALRQRPAARDLSLAVGRLPIAESGGQPIDGLLGRDVLAIFDVLIDVPGRRLTLFQVRNCRGNFLPWQTPYTAIPVRPDYGHAMVIPVQLDGHVLRAMPDTGSSRTVLIAPGMARLALTPQALAGDSIGVARGIGRYSVQVQAHRFSSLRIGDDTSNRPTLLVAPLRVVPMIDLLLGLDWLQSHEVWLSYSTMQIFVGS
jgi:hypothetical protein